MLQYLKLLGEKMHGLIILVHGSRQKETKKELEDFIKEISQGIIIQSAYMEIQQPNLQEAVKLLIKKKCTKISILPFFILAGRHMREDIPKQVQESQDLFPNVKLKLLKHLIQLSGAKTALGELIKRNLNNS